MHELFEFPPKQILNHRTSVVQKWKRMLQDFLNRAVRWIDLLKDDKFCQFIDIPKQTKAYLEELNKTAVDDEDEEEKEV